MSKNSPIKLVAIIAVVFVIAVIGIVSIPRIVKLGRNHADEDTPSSTYVETTRGSHSGSLSFGKDHSENTEESDSTVEAASSEVLDSTTEKASVQSKPTPPANNSTTGNTVKNPSISLSSDEESLIVGQYLYLSAKTNPSNCSVSWSSTDPYVATVSSSGKVSALNEGLVVITASFRYGDTTYSETCIVTVNSNKPAESSLAVYFYDGYIDNCGPNTVCLYDLEGTVTSNYNIEYIEIGIIGPVYINGTLQEIDQSHTCPLAYDLETTSITLEELASLYGDGFEFDIVAGEEYLVYVFAKDSSGETAWDYMDGIDFTANQ